LSLSETTHLALKPWQMLTRAARQTPADWSDLIEAQFAIIEAQLLIWTRPVGRFVSDAPTGSPDNREPLSGRSPEWRDAFRSARAVRMAADHGVLRPKCLVRAVALSRMLEKRGIRGSRVRVGVQQENGEFKAHAWVQLGQRVLGDDARHVATFARLLDVQAI
jgi:hypothetical protein